MTNNEPDISTKNVQNGKETTADAAPERQSLSGGWAV